MNYIIQADTAADVIEDLIKTLTHRAETIKGQMHTARLQSERVAVTARVKCVQDIVEMLKDTRIEPRTTK